MPPTHPACTSSCGVAERESWFAVSPGPARAARRPAVPAQRRRTGDAARASRSGKWRCRACGSARSRLLAPSLDIPRVGRVVAQSTFPGAERPLALSVPDSLRHLHVIGPTGVGKSTLLLGLITQDMAAGRGVS